MNHERIEFAMTQITETKLGAKAQGTIEAGPEQQERLQEFVERVRGGEFHVRVDEVIPRRCIDGRSPEDGFNDVAVNSAGGTETILVADLLTTERFHQDGANTNEDYGRVVDFLQDAGYKVGGHSDDHAEGEKSGCGANDKLPAIMHFMATEPDTLLQTAKAFGVNVDEATHSAITQKAASLVSEEGRFSAGGELLRTLREKAGDEAVDPLSGAHNEVIALINTEYGTTLDRNALKAEFGENYQAFNVDVWAFSEAAKAISLSEEEAKAKEVAMLYYNVAAAYVLGGPNLVATKSQFTLAA